MKYLFSNVLILNCIMALTLIIISFYRVRKQKTEENIMRIFCMSSAIWSYGFGMLFMQTDINKAHFWKSFAIFGTVLYMIMSLFLLCRISGLSKKISRILEGISMLGIPVYCLSVDKSATNYYMSDIGMTYNFEKGIISGIYSAYFVIVTIIILGVIIYMIKYAKLKRVKTFGKQFLIVSMLVVLGTVLDMVFPMMGYPSLPGSNVTQFWGILIVSVAMEAIRRNVINVSNMSGYIYHSLKTPVLVFDTDRRLRISNTAANEFLLIDEKSEDYENYELYNFFELNRNFDWKSTDCYSRNGHIPCNLEINEINDKYGDRIGYIIIIKDLSEIRKYIRELEEAREEANSSNMAKSRFLANMSHEIRTPMNAIIGFSELALNNQNNSEELKGYLTDIKNSSQNLMILINDILDFSKIESGRTVLVEVDYNMGDLLKSVYQIINNQAVKKGLDFMFEIDENIPAVMCGDPNRIQSIYINILNNAVKYTKEGFVSFKMTSEYKNEDTIIITAAISDSGIGIRDEDKKILFDSFTQVDQVTHYGKEGTGLGLALVKGFCRLMNGDVTVDSIYGTGSTFTAVIEQKVVDRTHISINLASSETIDTEFSLGNLRVKNMHALLVDDNEVNLRVISKSFEYYGLTLDMASNGYDAITLCRKNQYPIVFMDQMMPGMDGIETMHKLRRLSDFYEKECKIIVVTANAVSGVKESLIAEGFDNYLSKPIVYGELENVLIECVDKQNIYYEKEKISSDNTNDNQSATVLTAARLQEIFKEINVEKGLTYCGGQVEVYISVLEVFCRNAESTIELLNGYRELKDLPNYRIYAHSMKGASLNIGADELGAMGKRLEFAARDNEPDIIEAETDAFIAEYRALVRKISDTLNFTKPDNSRDNNDELLGKIKTAITDYDYAGAASLLRGSHGKQYSAEVESILARLDKMMEEMDIDGMEALLEINT